MTSKQQPSSSSVQQPRGVLMTRTQVADMLGVAFTTIQRWDRKGLRPVVPGDPARSQTTLYDSADAIDFFIAQKLLRLVGHDPALGAEPLRDGSVEYLNRDQELARLYQAQRKKLERENAERRAQLLDAKEVAVVQEISTAHICARLLEISSRIASQLASETNRARCATIIEDAVYDALTELSETRVLPEGDDA